MPVFTYDNNIGLLAHERLTVRTQETVADLVGDIKPPCINAVITHPIYAKIGEVFYDLGVCGIELRHRFDAGEGAVAAVGIPYEPVVILRCFAELLRI